MKKYFLSTAMCLVMAACGSSKSDSDNGQKPAPETPSGTTQPTSAPDGRGIGADYLPAKVNYPVGASLYSLDTEFVKQDQTYVAKNSVPLPRDIPDYIVVAFVIPNSMRDQVKGHEVMATLVDKATGNRTPLYVLALDTEQRDGVNIDGISVGGIPARLGEMASAQRTLEIKLIGSDTRVMGTFEITLVR